MATNETTATPGAHASAQTDQLTFAAYAGDGATLLAFDVPKELQPQLAGFAVQYSDPTGKSYEVPNRLSFELPVTSQTTAETRPYWPSSQAPLQKFHWVHFPADVVAGTFTYTATAMFFKPGSDTEIIAGPQADVAVQLMPETQEKLELGFTRGYISSQAYVDEFHNAPIEPEPPTFDFDTTPYQAQYHWLGFHARHLVFDFLNEVLADPSLSLDVFAYDLNEPDVIHQLETIGARLRLYLDNSKSHVGERAREPKAMQALLDAGAQAKVGHFSRFSHSKVFILKRGEQTVKVLAGSANFSVRGLYVQSNNVFVIDDPAAADLYEQAFNQTWNDPTKFRDSPIAAKWFDLGGSDGLPAFSLCFSPHTDPATSLERVTKAVTDASSSVLFAIMELGGSGGLLEAIMQLPTRKDLYAFGTTQRLHDGAVEVTKSGVQPTFIPFSYLSHQVPAPFRQEWNGGAGQVIHHKFVVTDFNRDNPLAFAGSSNLASGGEHQNGDNLVCFANRRIATMYAIEAIKLVDHYRFRSVMHDATDAKPLRLKPRSEQWAADYYDQTNPKYRERTLFATPITP